MCYFDENKPGPDNPHFFIGGLLIPDQQTLDFESTLSQIAFNFFGARSLIQANEFHGKGLFHGKGNAKGCKLEERVQMFRDIATFVTNESLGAPEGFDRGLMLGERGMVQSQKGLFSTMGCERVPGLAGFDQVLIQLAALAPVCAL